MTMQSTHAVGDRSARIAPRLVAYAARSIPVSIFVQFLLAGLSLFENAALWEWHSMLGFLMMVPIGIVVVAAFRSVSVRPLRWWAMTLAILYVLQFVFIIAGQNTGSGILKALHPFNGCLLLTAALVIVAKIERSHSG